MTQFDKHQSIFCLGWLANTNAGVTGTDVELQENATTNIQTGLNDPTIIVRLGSYGNPVWGPVTANSSALSGSQTEYVTNNLVYTVQIKNQFNLDYLYVIGIAGTNPIFWAGWFQEDLNITLSVPWSGTTSGNISTGTATGLARLLSIKDETQGYLMDFLRTELSTLPEGAKVEIAVTGHSLGGALSSVLALKIKEILGQSCVNSNLAVSAWSTAGPTLGDETFANYLVSTLSSENYNSLYNHYDIVPHAWKKTLLSCIPDLYQDFPDPFAIDQNIQGNAIIQGLVNWAITQSSSDYTRAPDAIIPLLHRKNFTIKEKGDLEVMAEGIINDSKYNDIKQDMQTILQQTSSSQASLTVEDVRSVLVFLAEAGYQHTKAYLNYFFNSQYPNADAMPTKQDETFISALEKYVSADTSSLGKELDIENVTLFLSMVVTS